MRDEQRERERQEYTGRLAGLTMSQLTSVSMHSRSLGVYCCLTSVPFLVVDRCPARDDSKDEERREVR